MFAVYSIGLEVASLSQLTSAPLRQLWVLQGHARTLYKQIMELL